MNNNIILDLVIYTCSENDLLLLTKLSLISKSFYDYLEPKILKNKSIFIEKLKNIPIKQEYVGYNTTKTDQTYKYSNFYIKKYIGRRLFNLWEISQFNVYLIKHTNLCLATRRNSLDYDIFQIDSNGIIRTLPSNSNKIYCDDKALILRKISKNYKYNSLIFPFYNKHIEKLSSLMHSELSN